MVKTHYHRPTETRVKIEFCRKATTTKRNDDDGILDGSLRPIINIACLPSRGGSRVRRHHPVQPRRGDSRKTHTHPHIHMCTPASLVVVRSSRVTVICGYLLVQKPISDFRNVHLRPTRWNWNCVHRLLPENADREQCSLAQSKTTATKFCLFMSYRSILKIVSKDRILFIVHACRLLPHVRVCAFCPFEVIIECMFNFWSLFRVVKICGR